MIVEVLGKPTPNDKHEAIAIVCGWTPSKAETSNSQPTGRQQKILFVKKAWYWLLAFLAWPPNCNRHEDWFSEQQETAPPGPPLRNSYHQHWPWVILHAMSRNGLLLSIWFSSSIRIAFLRASYYIPIGWSHAMDVAHGCWYVRERL